MRDIGLDFCSPGSRMEMGMGIHGPKGALLRARGIREDKKARKNKD